MDKKFRRRTGLQDCLGTFVKRKIIYAVAVVVFFGLAVLAVVFFLALVALFLGAPVDFAVPTAFFAFGVGVARVFRVLA